MPINPNTAVQCAIAAVEVIARPVTRKAKLAAGQRAALAEKVQVGYGRGGYWDRQFFGFALAPREFSPQV